MSVYTTGNNADVAPSVHVKDEQDKSASQTLHIDCSREHAIP